MEIKKGDKFNRLIAIDLSYVNKKGRLYWLFRCECGNEKNIYIENVKCGGTKSCGCLRKEGK